MRRSRPRPKDRTSAWTGARVVLVLVAAIVFLVGAAFTAANLVPATRADDQSQPVDQNQLAPAECDSVQIANTVSGTGIIAGTIDNDWIIGSEAIDTIDGLAGDDCIEGKESDDVITGGLGTDVCIGGGGNDTFVGCETEIQ